MAFRAQCSVVGLYFQSTEKEGQNGQEGIKAKNELGIKVPQGLCSCLSGARPCARWQLTKALAQARELLGLGGPHCRDFVGTGG